MKDACKEKLQKSQGNQIIHFLERENARSACTILVDLGQSINTWKLRE